MFKYKKQIQLSFCLFIFSILNSAAYAESGIKQPPSLKDYIQTECKSQTGTKVSSEELYKCHFLSTIQYQACLKPMFQKAIEMSKKLSSIDNKLLAYTLARSYAFCASSYTDYAYSSLKSSAENKISTVQQDAKKLIDKVSADETLKSKMFRKFKARPVLIISSIRKFYCESYDVFSKEREACQNKIRPHFRPCISHTKSNFPNLLSVATSLKNEVELGFLFAKKVKTCIDKKI